MESLVLRVPVLASDNGTRPAGVELWTADDPNCLLKLMIAAVTDRVAMMSRMPERLPEDNMRKLADDIEMVCQRETAPTAAESASTALTGR
jgi:hypothetical protein